MARHLAAGDSDNHRPTIQANWETRLWWCVSAHFTCVLWVSMLTSAYWWCIWARLNYLNTCKDIKCIPRVHLSLQLWPYTGSQKHTHSRSVASGSFLTVESIRLLIFFLVSFDNLVNVSSLTAKKWILQWWIRFRIKKGLGIIKSWEINDMLLQQ